MNNHPLFQSRKAKLSMLGLLLLTTSLFVAAFSPLATEIVVTYMVIVGSLSGVYNVVQGRIDALGGPPPPPPLPPPEVK